MPKKTTNLLNDLPKEQRDKLRRRKSPQWMRPMLATVTEDRFSDEQCIFERKLDGERCLAMRDGKVVSLTSRNRKRLNATYPEIVDVLETQSCDRFLVDGEVVAFDGAVTNFSRLNVRNWNRNETASCALSPTVQRMIRTFSTGGGMIDLSSQHCCYIEAS